jgi:hypothetical protein
VGYAANNPAIYVAAFAGGLAGLATFGRYPTDTAQSRYAHIAQQADAFAQEIDAVWGITPFTSVDLLQLRTLAQAVWIDRSPLKSDSGIAASPGSYLELAQAVVAATRAGTTQVVAEGVDPNSGPSPSPSLKSKTVTGDYVMQPTDQQVCVNTPAAVSTNITLPPPVASLYVVITAINGTPNVTLYAFSGNIQIPLSGGGAPVYATNRVNGSFIFTADGTDYHLIASA